jgi:hypothetical protein
MNLRNGRLSVLLWTLLPITAVSQIKSETNNLQSESRRRGNKKGRTRNECLRLAVVLLKS